MSQEVDNIVSKAAELGKLIGASPAGTEMIKARKQLHTDKQAHKMLEAYQEQMQRIAQLEKDGQPVEPQDKHKLVELQQKVASQTALKAWMKAQADFSQLMHKVNQAIAAPFMDTAPQEQPEEA